MYSHANLNHSSIVYSVSWQPLSDIEYHSLVRHLKSIQMLFITELHFAWWTSFHSFKTLCSFRKWLHHHGELLAHPVTLTGLQVVSKISVQLESLTSQRWLMFQSLWTESVMTHRTVMKSGSELVKAGVRMFFENAAEDLEKTLENLKLGKLGQSRTQMKGVTQIINYTSAALLPILTVLFQHITQYHFGTELLCESAFLSPTVWCSFSWVNEILSHDYQFLSIFSPHY